MLVNEIFSSIDGEGIRTGYPVTFIRLFGCNLSCPYCDTRYSCVGKDYKEMSVNTIVDKVREFGFKRITLTGGEPLIHKDVDNLLITLRYLGYEVNIETNGSVDIGKYLDWDDIILTVDYKTISSKMNKFNKLENLKKLRKTDVLKFVVGSIEDLEDMQQVVEKYQPHCEIFISPVFGEIDPIDIVDFIKDNKLEQCRVQLQLHKFIWKPMERGV